MRIDSHKTTDAGNVKRKASRMLSRPTLETDILDEQSTFRTPSARSWKAEQQAPEDLRTGRIATLEEEFTKVRIELEQARKATPLTVVAQPNPA
ncbi:hypothetical protein KXW58_004929 [Aspergillus fumigatus]|nr:hypothetical protein KXW58_004929 [Aspergillus fumigatus]